MTTYQVPDRPVDLTSARFTDQGYTIEISDWPSSVAYMCNNDNSFSKAISFVALKDDLKMWKCLEALEEAEVAVKAK